MQNAQPAGTALSEQKVNQLQDDSRLLQLALDEMGKVVVGQERMARALCLGLITGGHVLLEGLPGLAKTLAVKTLAGVMDASFKRIQFTPDLLPSDLIGTLIYRPQSGDFVPKKGPLFANIVLADEINRAPAKVQSALLEAMAEKQITIGEETYRLEEPFLVLATQNPIEQEGTYRLPEAQLDRFLFKVQIGYPTRTEEKQILSRMGHAHSLDVKPILDKARILAIRERLDWIYVDERIEDYILRLVMATRKEAPMSAEEANLDSLKELRSLIQVGASPRATLFLHQAARAVALLEQRQYVTPEDVKSIAHEVLRHRLILTFDAEARGMGTESCIHQLLETVSVP